MRVRMSVHLQTVKYLSGHLPTPDCCHCLWFPVFRNIGPCAQCGAVTRTGSCSTPPTSVGMSSNPSGLSPETPRPKTYVPPHLRQRVTPGTPSPSHSPSSSPHARWYVCRCVGVRMLKLTVEHLGQTIRVYSRQQYNVNVSFCFCSVFMERFDHSTVIL